MKKKILLSLVIASQYVNAGITELVYVPQKINLNNDTVRISSPKHPHLHPGDGRARLFIHNFIKPDEGERLVDYSRYWTHQQFTGLNGRQEWGFADRGANMGFGVTSVQSFDHKVGMMLNSFDYNDGNGKSHRFDKENLSGDPKTFSSGIAIQYNVDWAGSGLSIWNKSPDDLCVIAKADVHSAYAENGYVNQAIITLKFRSTKTYYDNNQNLRYPEFYYNILMYDSRHNTSINRIQQDRKGDTGNPIVITGSGIDSNYGHPNPNSSIHLVSRGTLPQGKFNYGVCINRSEMDNILNEIRENNVDKHSKPIAKDRNGNNIYLNVNSNNIRLQGVTIGPEGARTKKGSNGYIGMSVDELWVYRAN